MQPSKLVPLLVVAGAALAAASPVGGGARAVSGAIAFESTRSGNSDIYLTTDGRVAKRLTATTAHDVTPTLSPDGQNVVFASYRGGRWGLYTVPAAGGQERRLVVKPPSPIGPRLSPDGDQLAFLSADAAGRYSVWVSDADGANARRLTPAGAEDASPSWSPKSDQVVLSRKVKGGFALWIVDVSTGRATQLTKPAVGDFEPDWSPDGERIAFSRIDRTGNYDIWVLPVAEPAKAVRLTRVPAEDGGPIWSPDGGQIGFRTSRAGFYQLWSVPAEGGRATRLILPGRGADVALDWSPVAHATRRPAAAAAPARVAFFCTLSGNDSNNILNGGGGDDDICAKGGADKARGNGGLDEIDGGCGNDRFSSVGSWVDGLMGGDQNDILYARAKCAPSPDCDYANGQGGGLGNIAWVDWQAKVPCGGGTTAFDVWANATKRPT